VELIAEPYASMVYVAVFTGLRVSELAGLRWRNVHEDAITIEERYYRGDWGAPKSEASNATIPVILSTDTWRRIARIELNGPIGAAKYSESFAANLVLSRDGSFLFVIRPLDPV
jgi:integrase